MAKFYGLHYGLYPGVPGRLKSLKEACEARHVEFVSLDTSVLNQSDMPTCHPKDMVFNIARGGEVHESLLLSNDVRHFYKKTPLLVENNGDTTKYILPLEASGIPGPKTLYVNYSKSDQLDRIVQQLNGFPLIVKVPGGTLGVGVMMVESKPALVSLLDLCISQYGGAYLRKFIHPKEVARLIVIGDRVVAANEKAIPAGDFRTSVKEKDPIPKKYPDEINRVAVLAAHSCNFENCGVDIVIDQAGQPFVLEVNMPHDFITTEMVTGLDIAGMMIDHLLSK